MLDKMLDSGAHGCTPAVAPQRAALQAAALTQTRIDERAEQLNEGERTEAEQREDEAYGEMMALLGIVQAKARAILASSAAAHGDRGRGATVERERLFHGIA